jgi:uncharacterized protein YndB with AHSA1/START domain
MKAMAQTMTETRQHETVISLPATPEDVWRALTEAGSVETWYAPIARIDAREGGEYFVSWGPGMDGPGVIETFEPGRHLRVVAERKQTETPGDAAPPEPVRIAIDFFLESEQGSTTLRLVHSGFGNSAAWDREYDGTKQGWPIMLGILQYGLHKHRGEAGKQRWVYAMAALPQQETWARFRDLFGGSTPVFAPIFAKEPWTFCAEWNEFGSGLVYGAFGERQGVTGVSLHVVLYGEAMARIDEAAKYWCGRLASEFPPVPA